MTCSPSQAEEEFQAPGDDLVSRDFEATPDYVLVSRSQLELLVAHLSSPGTQVEWHHQDNSAGFLATITSDDSPPTQWSSSPLLLQPGHRRYAVDAVLSAASTLVGGTDTTTVEFLDLLGLHHPSPTSLWRMAQDKLAPLVHTACEDNMEKVRLAMSRSPEPECLQMDEQWSRPQRNGTLGQAPYCSANVLWDKTAQVCSSRHVNRKPPGSQSTMTHAEATTEARAQAFSLLAQELRCEIKAISSDACSTASRDIKQFLTPAWPGLIEQRDLWHKTKSWKTGFTKFARSKPKKGSRLWCYPHLRQAADAEGKHITGILKKHFVYCSHTCEGSSQTFLDTFCGAASHLAHKYSLPPDEEAALKEWLLDLVRKDHHYFLHGLQTSQTESYHATCNKYYPKGYRFNFQSYCMRKELATLHWNNLKVPDPTAWRWGLLKDYLGFIAA